MSGSDPGWANGYPPTAAEWAAVFDSKLDKLQTALASGPSYANDAAAAVGGVPVGGIYRNGNFLMVRLS
jgi:hypothetical protein